MISLTILLILTSCVNEKPNVFDENNGESINSTITLVVPTGTIIIKEPTTVDPIENQIPFDQAYYDGTIVITRYYTYLGHGLHEEAYWLLSDNIKGSKSLDLEEYVESKQIAFKTVEIISIIPFHEDVRIQGGVVRTPDSPVQKRFTVSIKAWGQGKMSGSRMSGDLQHLFITLILEDKVWRIDNFSTSP